MILTLNGHRYRVKVEGDRLLLRPTRPGPHPLMITAPMFRDMLAGWSVSQSLAAGMAAARGETAPVADSTDPAQGGLPLAPPE